MDLTTLLIVIITFISWGTGSFIAKLATNRIGSKSVFFDAIAYVSAVIIYGLVIFKLKNLVQAERVGIGLALLAGVFGSFGLIGVYTLLSRAEVSSIVPLTALYPALTVTLAFIFLHESINPARILGIIFSLIAIYLLTR